MTDQTKPGPLAGITVLDLGQIYNGPYCGYLLAMAGARVVKVEPPGGERMRGSPGKPLASYPFMMLNGNKESITLNLKSDHGRELLCRLAAEADVLLENFSPGTMEKHGVGSDHLRTVNPRLIYAAATGFGRSGPHRDYRAMDITVQAMTGVVAVTGDDGQPPMKAGPALCDILGGVHLYAAITTALVRRERTGVGAVLDVAMQDAVFPTLITALGAYYQRGGTPPRTGNRHQGLAVAPYNVYRAKDGHVAIIGIRERHWQSLAKAMGRPELAVDRALPGHESASAEHGGDRCGGGGVDVHAGQGGSVPHLSTTRRDLCARAVLGRCVARPAPARTGRARQTRP